MGGVFQKIRKLGSSTKKTFISLCDEAYKQANIDDLQVLFEQENMQSVINEKRLTVKIKQKSIPKTYDYYLRKCKSARKFEDNKDLRSTIGNSKTISRSRIKDSISYQ